MQHGRVERDEARPLSTAKETKGSKGNRSKYNFRHGPFGAKPFETYATVKRPVRMGFEEFTPDSCLHRLVPLSHPFLSIAIVARVALLICRRLQRYVHGVLRIVRWALSMRHPAATGPGLSAGAWTTTAPRREVQLELARASAANARRSIYGLGGSAQDAMRYSKLCLNAVFHEPLERSTAMKLVRSTRMLVLHEFRRYVRVPVMTEVGIVMADGGRIIATSQEISSGGMSLKGHHVPELASLVEVSFSLMPRVWVRGTLREETQQELGFVD